MAGMVVVQESFLNSALSLPKDTAKKVFKALHYLMANPLSPGLRPEKLSGRAKHLWSLRVDDDYRIIYHQAESKSPVLIYVGKHDNAYRVAERTDAHELILESRLSQPEIHPRGAPFDMARSEYPLMRDALPDALPLDEPVTCAPNEPSSLQDTPYDRVAPPSVPEPMEQVEEITGGTAKLEDVEAFVTSPKYVPLAFFLLNSAESPRVLGFDLVERIIGEPLPSSARTYRAWWANESGGRHVQARAWMAVGWKVRSVDFARMTVTFATE